MEICCIPMFLLLHWCCQNDVTFLVPLRPTTRINVALVQIFGRVNEDLTYKHK
jgi:hypothetical protein